MRSLVRGAYVCCVSRAQPMLGVFFRSSALPETLRGGNSWRQNGFPARAVAPVARHIYCTPPRGEMMLDLRLLGPDI